MRKINENMNKCKNPKCGYISYKVDNKGKCPNCGKKFVA